MSDFFAPEVTLPPCSKEAEESLIGGILVNQAGLEEISYLQAEDFYFAGPGAAWKAIQELKDSGMQVDILTVQDRLDKNGDLEKVGGPAALMSFVSNVSGLRYDSYARIVKDEAQRRALLSSAQELARIAYDHKIPCSDPLGKVMDDIVYAAQGANRGLRHISHALKKLVDYVDQRRLNPSKVWGIPTGLIDFDGYTGGLHPGEVMYIAGPPGCGKTTLGTQMVCSAATKANGKHPGAIYSFEMKEIQIVMRIVSGMGNVKTYDMHSGFLDDELYGAFLNDIALTETLPIYLCDKNMTPTEIRADLARAKVKYGIETYLIDYLLLMQGFNDLEDTPRSGALSRAIKNMTQDLDLAGITIASTTKEIFNVSEAMSMKSVRGSADVVFDADIVAMIQQNTSAGMQNFYNMIFSKTRNVAQGHGTTAIELYKERDYPVFRSAVWKSQDKAPNH